jgi:hypothetical protein
VYAFYLLSLFTDAAAIIDAFFLPYMNGDFFFSCPVYVFSCNLRQKKYIYVMKKGEKKKPTEANKLLLIIGFRFFCFFPSSFFD